MSIYNAVLEAQYTFIVEINLKHCAYVQVLKDLHYFNATFHEGPKFKSNNCYLWCYYC